MVEGAARVQELCDLSGSYSRVPGTLHYYPPHLHDGDPSGAILLQDGMQGYAWDRVRALGSAHLPTLKGVCNRANHVLDILPNFTSFELVTCCPTTPRGGAPYVTNHGSCA